MAYPGCKFLLMGIAISAWIAIAAASISVVAMGVTVAHSWRRQRSRTRGESRGRQRSEPKGWPWGGWFIALLGAVLILASVWGYAARRDGSATIGFAVIGAALVVVGAMSGRLAAGTLKIGPTGAEIPISEYQIQTGQVIDAEAAVEASLQGEGSLTADVAVPDKPAVAEADNLAQRSEAAKAVMVPGNAPPVFLTQLANDALNALTGADRQVAWMAVANLGNTAKTSDDKPIASTRSGVMYHQRKVTPDINLIYRQMDKTSEDDPDRYVIVAVERAPHRVRWWPDDIQFWP